MSGSPSPAPDAGAPSTDETAGQIAEQIYTSTSQVVFVIALASACIGILIAFRVRHVRYWRMRAYSAKVLDEIEMEFVNDDADMFVLEDDELPRGSRCQPFFHDTPTCADLCCQLLSGPFYFLWQGHVDLGNDAIVAAAGAATARRATITFYIVYVFSRSPLFRARARAARGSHGIATRVR